jgi:flavin-dependent dehydrogenase
MRDLANAAVEAAGGAFHVAVIGGGPAGSALAAHLARAGRRVALFEREAFPRDKLCGEFLSSEAQGLLADLGCLDRVLERNPHPIRWARFTTASGQVIDADLPAGAMGISRRALDEILFRHAEACGAHAFERAEVRWIEPGPGGAVLGEGAAGRRLEVRLAASDRPPSTLRVAAGVVVAAWGRRERLDRELSRAFLRRDHPSAGIKRHFRPRATAEGRRVAAELQGRVEVHGLDGGYCGLSLVETGEVNLCALLEKRFFKGVEAGRWEALRDALARANSLLGSRLAGLEPSEERFHSVGGVPFSRKERALGGILFVGDSAGMIAPLCGDGQAMALEAASLLARRILELPPFPSPEGLALLERGWDRSWRARFARRVLIGRWVQGALFRARLASGLVSLLKPFPPAVRALVGATRGSA